MSFFGQYTGTHSPAEKATRRQREVGPTKYDSWSRNIEAIIPQSEREHRAREQDSPTVRHVGPRMRKL